MSLKRSNRPADQSNKPQGSDTSNTGRRRITNSARELNRNEEQASPSGKQRGQMNTSQQYRDQTTGSNVPGSENLERSATANSERTGQQYSVTGNSSQIKDKEWTSGTPHRDMHSMREHPKVRSK